MNLIQTFSSLLECLWEITDGLPKVTIPVSNLSKLSDALKQEVNHGFGEDFTSWECFHKVDDGKIIFEHECGSITFIESKNGQGRQI